MDRAAAAPFIRAAGGLTGQAGGALGAGWARPASHIHGLMSMLYVLMQCPGDFNLRMAPEAIGPGSGGGETAADPSRSEEETPQKTMQHTNSVCMRNKRPSIMFF